MSRAVDRFLAELQTAAESGSRLSISGLKGSALALALSGLLERGQGPFLIVVAGPDEQERLVQDLRFFAPPQVLPECPPVLAYPGWDVPPYEDLSPHAFLALQRLEALHRLGAVDARALVVATGPALLKRVIPPDVLRARTIGLEPGQEVDRQALVKGLLEAGYLSTDLVEDQGCFCVRGGLIDIYPPLHDRPVRVELFGDEVESIREFDPETQRSLSSLSHLTLLPVREELLGPEEVARAGARLRDLGEGVECPTPVRRQVMEDMGHGIYFPGIDYYLGLLYERRATALEHLSWDRGRVVVVEPEQVGKALRTYVERLRGQYASRNLTTRFLPPPETLFEGAETLEMRLRHCPGLEVRELIQPGQGTSLRLQAEPTSGLRQTLLAHTGSSMLEPLAERLRTWTEEGTACLVACRSGVQARRLRDLLEPHGVRVPEALDGWHGLPEEVAWPGERPVLWPVVGELSGGLRLPGLTLLSEEDIFGPRVSSGPAINRKSLKSALSSFSQLNRGDAVVHRSHGVGIFRGLTRLEMAGLENDFLHIEYLGGDKLYLPVHKLDALQKYVGGEPRLDKLGGSTFEKTRGKVKRDVLKLARELLDLYAARALLQGNALAVDRRRMEELEATFPYEETADQLAAIDAVLADLASPRPMDRLVCGDVGYGKTEVAIRAAYAAVLSGRQVAVLVPTTVLALQHYKNFGARLEPFGVRVEMMSRFSTPAKQKETLAGIQRGNVDVVVGTHRLLSADIGFKDLGLLIVDEEHRFGVSHKEKIKKLRKNLDVLTMTATPIPRTLHMALTGLREFSLITTPPRDRLAIRTFHVEFNAQQIKEAIELELRRGGQVYFVHNRVQSIYPMARFLGKLLPGIRVGVAHGQMEEKALEKAMVDFIERQYDVLVCTAIIESGLDIPSVNTILIHRADWMGLAQLYQLRGRVGRSSARAYCYLITPPGQVLPEQSARRLRTLVEFTELGAGFRIANEDLEMRGAGDLLGSNQSGNINAVGLDLFCELLEQAVQELRGEESEEEPELEPEIELGVSAFIPEGYIPGLQGRLHYYKLLSDAQDEPSLIERAEEIEDRFGPLPRPVQALLEVMTVRLLARGLRLRGLKVSGTKLAIRLDERSPLSRDKLVRLVMKEGERYKLTPDQRLVVSLRPEEINEISRSIKNVLRNLS